MNRLISVVSCFLVSLMLPCVSEAQQLYVSTESGLGIGNSLGTLGSDTDFPTLCDRHLDPANHFSPAGITEPGECSSAASTWINSFGSSTGIISGVALGLRPTSGQELKWNIFGLACSTMRPQCSVEEERTFRTNRTRNSSAGRNA